MSRLAFTVRGMPAPQGSKRLLAHGALVESSSRVKPWRTDVKAAAEAALTGAPDWDPRGAFTVTITCRFPRPSAHYGTGSRAATVKASAPTWPVTRSSGDVDKLARAVLDALEASGAIHDDAAIADLIVRKRYSADGDPMGASVAVWRLP